MPDPLFSLKTSLAGRYRIEQEIGAGGMATVYRAHDLRHDRPVAVKVLRPELAAVIGVERFLAEIKTTANLQHAHILGLIDSGEVDNTVFYVMPFVDGESLRTKLAREKQIAIPEAVRIATAVSGALDYAHRRGVIHRDIKPENILLHEGQPLVADFGIALAMTRSGSGSGASRAGSGSRMTESGMSLGTPQYMSPEQAAGERNLDARTDIYALGCVLYEMLTGEPPFSGPTAQAIIAKVMTVEPQPVTTLRRSVPTNVAAATMTALNKVPADRFTTAADFAAALANPQYVTAEVAARRAASVWSRMSGRDIGALVTVVTLVIVALAGWLRNATTFVAPVAQFEIALADSEFGGPERVALSRDGARIVWSNPSGFFERSLDSLGVRRIRDAAVNAGNVREFSPDGREMLLTGRGGLGIAAAGGGPVRSLGVQGGRGSWAPDGNIYFTFGFQQPPRGIGRVAASGGTMDTIVKTDSQISDIVALPGGRGLVVTMNSGAGSELGVVDIARKEIRRLGRAGTSPQFVAPGYLLYVSGQSIMAAPFDEKRLAMTQDPVAFLEVPAGGVNWIAAVGNTLVYSPSSGQGRSGIAVRSRSGAERLLANVPDSVEFSAFSVSPDGKRFVAIGGQPQGRGNFRSTTPPNVFVYELAAGRMQRLRSDTADQNPSWLPSGREISFTRVAVDSPTTTSTLMRRAWDGSNAPTAILSRPGGPGRGGRGGSAFGSVAWIPDTKRGVVRVGTGRGGGTQPNGGARGGPGTAPDGRGRGEGGPPQGGGGGGRGGGAAGDLMVFSLDSPSKLDSLVATPWGENSPVVSPDGRLLAYSSNESGRDEVYVRSFATSDRRQVSNNGGAQPRWAHSGRELFYVSSDSLFVADIRTTPDLGAGEPRLLFVARGITGGYAVTAGDTAFIMRPSPANSPLVVTLNFTQQLARLFQKK